MPNGILPPGSRAYLLGLATSLAELSVFAPLEEGAAEGALMLARLDFAAFADSSSLAELNTAFSEAGVPPWPGYGYIVFASTAEPAVYLCWVKGIAWLPIIIGVIGTIALPPLLGAGLWLITPDPIKELIQSLPMLLMMVLVMFGMMKLIPALMPRERKREKIEERSR